MISSSRPLGRVVITALVCCIVEASGAAPEAATRQAADGLPLDVAGDTLPALRSLVDDDLQRRLEARLAADPGWKRLIEQERMAVGLVDLSDPTDVRFARVNGAVMMYAASLPKLAVLLAISQAMEEGIAADDAPTRELTREMISRSDNAAATEIYERLGFDYVESVLTAPRYGLYDIDNDGGLWIGKPYGVDGERHPDPVAGLVHGATVTQVCRFYYLLAFGQLVTRERSRQMLEVLVDPEIDHKFVHTLERVVPDAEVYRKSGTWQDWHADSVLVWGPVWRRYILVALVQDPSGETIMRRLVPAAEEVLSSR